MAAMRWWLSTTVLGILANVGMAVAEPITDRDYAIDFYDGVAIGNTAWVGMGGAGAANIVGTAGTLINPSAPAVRLTTDTDDWSWDYHIDVLTGTLSTDYDNNGVVSEDAGASLVTLGIGGRYHDWAAAATLTAQTAPSMRRCRPKRCAFASWSRSTFRTAISPSGSACKQ